MKRSFILFICFSMISLYAQNADSLKQAKMKWFKDAKLGIFIHWGIYAVDGI
jgi:alpha-L-fucosidase